MRACTVSSWPCLLQRRRRARRCAGPARRSPEPSARPVRRLPEDDRLALVGDADRGDPLRRRRPARPSPARRRGSCPRSPRHRARPSRAADNAGRGPAAREPRQAPSAREQHRAGAGRAFVDDEESVAHATPSSPQRNWGPCGFGDTKASMDSSFRWNDDSAHDVGGGWTASTSSSSAAGSTGRRSRATRRSAAPGAAGREGRSRRPYQLGLVQADPWRAALSRILRVPAGPRGVARAGDIAAHRAAYRPYQGPAALTIARAETLRPPDSSASRRRPRGGRRATRCGSRSRRRARPRRAR